MAVEGFPKLGRLETALDPKSKPRKLRNIASTRSSIVVIVVVGIFGIISHQHNHRTEAYIGMSPRLFYWELRRRYCSKVNLLSVCHRRIPVSTNKPGLPGTSSWQQLRTSASPLSFPFISSLPQLETATTDTPSAAVSTTYQIVFDIVVPEGRCVGLKVMDVPDSHPDALRYDAVAAISNVTTKPHWINDCLHPEEVNFGVQSLKGDTHRKSFWIGRLAMRQALVAYDRPLSQPRQQPWDAPNISIDSIRNSQSILKDTHGRPKLPYGFLGSISHKGNMGVALVTKENVSAHQVAVPPKWGIGVDIEEAIHADRRKIARKVLTLNEQADLGRIPGVSIEEEVLLRFSLKESVYKAMHPLICQYVGFKEAELQPLPDGSANITLFLKSNAHKSFESVEAHWRRCGDFFLCSACVRLNDQEWNRRIQSGDHCLVP